MLSEGIAAESPEFLEKVEAWKPKLRAWADRVQPLSVDQLKVLLKAQGKSFEKALIAGADAQKNVRAKTQGGMPGWRALQPEQVPGSGEPREQAAQALRSLIDGYFAVAKVERSGDSDGEKLLAASITGTLVTGFLAGLASLGNAPSPILDVCLGAFGVFLGVNLVTALKLSLKNRPVTKVQSTWQAMFRSWPMQSAEQVETSHRMLNREWHLHFGEREPEGLRSVAFHSGKKPYSDALHTLAPYFAMLEAVGDAPLSKLFLDAESKAQAELPPKSPCVGVLEKFRIGGAVDAKPENPAEQTNESAAESLEDEFDLAPAKAGASS